MIPQSLDQALFELKIQKLKTEKLKKEWVAVRTKHQQEVENLKKEVSQK
jgi:hypothetical protein